tara:strand:- start:110 stop:424 length:315 start_codon:yes stop_codon:yes gene_type:complete
MPNKHFCQGTNCHKYSTTDRFLKSKGIIRGRYAILKRDSESDWCSRGKYFCSTRCESDWLNNNMENIERGIPVPFIRERRFTEGYYKTKGTWGQNYIQKIETNS